MWSASAVFYGVVTGFVIFLALEKVWGWVKALTTKPAPPPPPPERTLTTKDLEDILDMFIQYQGSVVTDGPVQVAPVEQPAPNGHHDIDTEEEMAMYFARLQSDTQQPEKEDTMAEIASSTRDALKDAGLLVIDPEPKQPAKGKKKGKK